MCVGIPGQVVAIIDADKQLAAVDFAGLRRPVNLACVIDSEHPIESCCGDWVLVHVGFALNRINEAEAQRTLELLEELDEWATERQALRSGSDPA